MVNYKITYLQSALNDLEEIVLYISNYSKTNAIKWHDKLIDSINNLSRFPLMGVPVPDKKIADLGFRMIPIDNYVVFYKFYESQNEVSILRVLNAKRDYPNLLNY